MYVFTFDIALGLDRVLFFIFKFNLVQYLFSDCTKFKRSSKVNGKKPCQNSQQVIVILAKKKKQKITKTLQKRSRKTQKNRSPKKNQKKK